MRLKKFVKIIIVSAISALVCFFGWRVYQNFSAIKSSTSDHVVVNQPEAGELYYVRGCDNLSFISVYRKFSGSDTKIIGDLEKHNDIAEKDFSKAIELIPDCANAYWKRGRCKHNRWRWYGKPEDNLAAIADYKRAIVLAPASTAVHYSLLRSYLNAGNSALAKKEFEIVIQLDPDRRTRRDLEREMQRYDTR